MDRARSFGIEIALDLAFQCAPDHPYVSAHPQWFKHRPDGSVQYAENPPKKYQDIYPFDFESDDWRACGRSSRAWSSSGSLRASCIFRVDNPHTKPFGFWEWLITRGEARQSRRDLSRRGVHAAEGHAPARQVGLHAVVHLLHLAQHQAGAHGVLHRAGARPRRANTFVRTSGRIRPTSCTKRCSRGCGRCSPQGWCSPRPCPPTTASTAPPTS